MCGIAGIFQYSGRSPAPIDRRLAATITDSLIHRGPDDGGVYLADGIFLGHRRLSILDPTDRGHQPMADPQGRVWIVFNGEIYNFPELRKELEGCGRHFTTRTDTEVILQAYLQWDMEAVRRLNGMFALAIWDVRRRRLWLARDPVGIKPLFYSDSGGVLRFGSEVKALLADPAVAREPDLAAIDAFLSFGYVPAPRTGFAGIVQLEPGHSLVAEEGRVSVRRDYRLPYPDRPAEVSEAEAIAGFRSGLLDAVQRQKISDVPMGAFLSGGLDSSAVAWAMQRGGSPAQVFCIGFDDPSFDETPYAREVANRLGAEFHGQKIAPAMADCLQVAVSHAEELFADNSMIPLLYLSRFVGQHVKVALLGDGGDELLAGYMTYKASRLAPWYRRIPRLVRRGLIAPAVRALPPSRRKYGLATLARRFVEGAEEPGLRSHCSWRQIFFSNEKDSLYSPEMRRMAAEHDPIGSYAAHLDDAPEWLTPLEQQLHVDFRFHLSNDILAKVDRMSMAHSLEVRVPLLDLELVKTCLRLPPDMKLRGGTTKYVLRRSLEGVLPPRLLRRKKTGFIVPLETWMRGPMLPLIRETLSERLLRDMGLLSPDYLGTMIDGQASGRRDYAYSLFTLLVLGIWWRIWIERSLPAQCVRRPDAAPLRYEAG